MAVKENNGLIYGIGKLSFCGKEIGWISQDGLAPAGEDVQTTPIYAAQVTDGPVDELVTSPGSTAFTFTLIQLNAQSCVDLLGGEVSAKDGHTNLPRALPIWKARSWWIASAATRLKSPAGKSAAR